MSRLTLYVMSLCRSVWSRVAPLESNKYLVTNWGNIDLRINYAKFLWPNAWYSWVNSDKCFTMASELKRWMIYLYIVQLKCPVMILSETQPNNVFITVEVCWGLRTEEERIAVWKVMRSWQVEELRFLRWWRPPGSLWRMEDTLTVLDHGTSLFHKWTHSKTERTEPLEGDGGVSPNSSKY